MYGSTTINFNLFSQKPFFMMKIIFFKKEDLWHFATSFKSKLGRYGPKHYSER